MNKINSFSVKPAHLLMYILNIKNHITCATSPEIVVENQQNQTELFPVCPSIRQGKKQIINPIRVSRQVSVKVLRNAQAKLPPSNYQHIRKKKI